MAPIDKPLLRIASASGAVTDRRCGFESIARDEDVQFIIGDWMSEMNMTLRAAGKFKGKGESAEYEPAFLDAIEPALPYIASKKIKIACNAGSSDAEKLCQELTSLVATKGLDLKVAWVGGDEVIDSVLADLENGSDFRSLTTGKNLSEWECKPFYAQCYLGCWGIVEGFKGGADIVICGRVADASPVIACAAYHYGWGRKSFRELAHAFVAGHLIECSTYVSGGNFSDFKSLSKNCMQIGFPIAEILPSGEFFITKQKYSDGAVTLKTCKAQLLYEIQGPLYYHSDVVAVLDDIKFEMAGENRIFVTNIGSRNPPATTKVGLTAMGGFQAEAHYFLCGLDLEDKAKMLEKQLRGLLDESKYHCLKFSLNGRCLENPLTQESATVDFRVFAQARDESDLSPKRFLQPIMGNIMQGYPGATFAMDTRQGLPKPYYEYWVTLFPQRKVKHVCHLPHKQESIQIEAPTNTEPFVHEQVSYETTNPIDLRIFGPSTLAPLGFVVHARSGDKGSDANVGFFVRSRDEWDWLRSVLTVDKIKELLGADYTGNPIFRFELPNIWAVHFLLKDHLDRGVGANSTYDVLGKNLAEYLRAKHMDIPNVFLDRGRI